MARVLLVHWNAQEAQARAKALRGAGHSVECHSSQGGEGLRELRAAPPEAIVIDLSRLPSHGRAVGTFLRQQKATRAVPLVFVEGDPAKTARVRELLPDAVYTDWRRVRSGLREALRSSPRRPVVPGTMAGYSGTPLPRKLGIRSGSTVALLGAPRDFEATLGELPAGARLRRGARGPADVVLRFARTRAELAREFDKAGALAVEGGRMWVVWPKRASGVLTDLSGNDVRAFGLERGWVDFKICAVDATWSGLCFSRRAARRPARKA